MNIFILDEQMELNAKCYVDKHIIKIPLEIAQMISTAYHVSDYKWKPNFLFKLTHKNHPWTKWIRHTPLNFRYACHFGMTLYNEYQYRYNKPDKMQRVKQIFQYGLKHTPKCETKLSLLMAFPQAMPDECKNENAILAYRQYYNKYKSHLFNWKNRVKPYWIRKE